MSKNFENFDKSENIEKTEDLKGGEKEKESIRDKIADFFGIKIKDPEVVKPSMDAGDNNEKVNKFKEGLKVENFKSEYDEETQKKMEQYFNNESDNNDDTKEDNERERERELER